MEFTKIAPRVVGQRNNYVYGLSAAARNAFPFNQLIKRNLASRHTETHAFGGHFIADERVFMTRLGQNAEDDGWMIGTHLDTQTAVANLAVLDEQAVDAVPLAIEAPPCPLPFGLHGIFVADR